MGRKTLHNPIQLEEDDVYLNADQKMGYWSMKSNDLSVSREILEQMLGVVFAWFCVIWLAVLSDVECVTVQP